MKTKGTPSLEARITETLETFVEKKDTVVLAVSGGPDSMFLLDVCRRVLEKGQILAAHFNHHVRKDSAVDEGIVRAYCAKHGIAFMLGSADIPRKAQMAKKGLEETGRIARYAFLERVRKKEKAAYILTAHHADDQIETILLHFIRGSGVHGLTGMPMLSGRILRPLLGVTKKEILAYLKAKKIRYATDSTNLVSDTSRNLLRLEVIPLIEKINPGFAKTILHSSALSSDLSVFLSDEAEAFLEAFSSSQGIDQPAFISLPLVLQREVLRKLYVDAHGSAEGLYSPELEEVRRFFLTSVTGKKKAFGKRIIFANKQKRVAYSS